MFVSLGGWSQRGSEDHSSFLATELPVRFGRGAGLRSHRRGKDLFQFTCYTGLAGGWEWGTSVGSTGDRNREGS